MKQSLIPCVTLLLTAISSFIYAQEPSSDTTAHTQASSSGRLDVKHGTNLIVKGDWIFWQPNETGLSFAIQQEGFDPLFPETMGVGKVINPDYHWSSGFRLGLGFNIPHDQWDTALVWTNYTGKATKHVDGSESDLLFPSFIHPNTLNNEAIFSCLTADGDLTIHLNVLDLDLGRTFKGGNNFSLRPSIGLRSAWVYQRYELEYDDLFYYDTIDNSLAPALQNYYTHLNNNFWGLGPKIGLDLNLSIRWGLSLFGNLDLSLLYGLFELSNSEDFTGFGSVEGVAIKDTNSFHAGRAVTDVQLGFRWNHSFRQDRFRLQLQAAWENHMFFSQNQFMRFVNGSSWGLFTQNQGDLSFQGWSLSAGLFF